ncbi:hypothetical protein AIOL_002805 [Candidatus Rhodobacter oscarellae]|uniref:Uncharacterized protein n=2 Tax=Candidatus Rhodobacter oscarellae TaxID=1675527 RepID=A0A0J9E525_9RHOB|nr:hypothetical protein AIOL_002805 [Candidatus Rhodobacter lobularis]
MGELVAGEVGYQIQKHCPDIRMRRLRALGKLNRLADYARDQGYSDKDFDALSKDPEARALRDGRVDAYLNAQGVTKGDVDSYCQLGYREIEAKTFVGRLLR